MDRMLVCFMFVLAMWSDGKFDLSPYSDDEINWSDEEQHLVYQAIYAMSLD